MKLALFLVTVAACAQPKVAQHMILLEPTGTDLSVAETLIVEGEGTIKFSVYVPPEAGQPNVRGGNVRKTAKPGVFEITPAATGAERRIDVAWTMPFVVPEVLAGQILHGGSSVRIVVPRGVKVDSQDLESNGVEPTTQAAIFTVKGNRFRLALDGAGSLQAAEAAPTPAAEDGPTMEQILPRIYDRKYWILGLTFGILAIGFYLNFKGAAKT